MSVCILRKERLVHHHHQRCVVLSMLNVCIACTGCGFSAVYIIWVVVCKDHCYYIHCNTVHEVQNRDSLKGDRGKTSYEDVSPIAFPPFL